MTHYAINNDPEPIRLFKSDFLEFFTHIHPAVVVIIWLPFSLYLIISGSIAGRSQGQSLWYMLVAFLIGLIVWSFAEYFLHRFVFHFRPRNAAQERIVYLFHGVHHHQPQCKTRLVMPPVVSIPLAALFGGFFWLIVGVLFGLPGWVRPMFGGFIIGYLVYDLTHYATHHFPMRSGIFKYLKRYHMMHHYRTPDQRFGVSSPIWDYLFHTKPEENQ